MKLLELIEYIKTPDRFDDLLNKELPNVEFDLVEVYMVESISLDSEIRFFDAEKIPGNIEIEVDGIKYINLFPLYLTQELIEEFRDLGKINNNMDIAKRLIEYWLKDA